MKQGTEDQIKSRLHEVKGKVKETAGQVTNNPDLEVEGQVEKFGGKVQKKVGQILDVNLAACVLHGVKREDLIGRNALKNLIPSSRREEARRDFQKLASGELFWVEGESERADGRIVPVEVRASRIQYAAKPALLLHVRDVTERRAAEAALSVPSVFLFPRARS